MTPKEMDVFYEASADEPVWYVFRDERHFGPFSIQWIQELIALGVIREDHHVWQPKLKEWKSIRNFENLRSYSHGVNPQTLSDNDFESILQAEELKREKRFELDSLDFVAPETSKIPTLQSEPTGKSIPSLIRDKALKVSDLLKELRQTHPRKAVILSIVSVVTFVFLTYSAVSGIHLTSTEKELLSRLSPEDMSKAEEILAHKAEDGVLRAGLFTTIGNRDLVVVSNQSKDSPRSMILTGVPGTLVGYQRWNRNIAVEADRYVSKIRSKILNISEIPHGEYEVTMKANGVATSKWMNTPEGVGEYQKDLNKYKGAMQTQSILEQEEITQVYAKLQEHFDFTLGEFQKFKKTDARRRSKIWKRHERNWKQDQARFDQVFASLSSSDFVNQLVYADIYLELSEISKQIALLQNQQSMLILHRKTVAVSDSARQAKLVQDKLNRLQKTVNRWNKD